MIKVVEDEVEIDEQELVSVQDMSEYADVEDTEVLYVEEEVEEEQIFDDVFDAKNNLPDDYVSDDE